MRIVNHHFEKVSDCLNTQSQNFDGLIVQMMSVCLQAMETGQTGSKNESISLDTASYFLVQVNTTNCILIKGNVGGGQHALFCLCERLNIGWSLLIIQLECFCRCFYTSISSYILIYIISYLLIYHPLSGKRVIDVAGWLALYGQHCMVSTIWFECTHVL